MIWASTVLLQITGLGYTISKGRDMMPKLMNYPTARKRAAGKSIQVPQRTRTRERIVDPRGMLTVPSNGLSNESQEAMRDYKRKVKSGEIRISYP